MKYRSKGTLLQVGDGEDPEVFTTIPNVGDIDGPGGETSDIDVTDHSSSGDSDEFLPGTDDPGSLSAPVHHDPADTTHLQLEADAADKTVRNYQIVMVNADNYTQRFPAFVAQFRGSSPVKGARMKQLRLRITGPIVEPD